jgi:hypothetical protein
VQLHSCSSEHGTTSCRPSAEVIDSKGRSHQAHKVVTQNDLLATLQHFQKLLQGMKHVNSV